MKKRITALLMGLMLAFSFAACGKGGGEETPPAKTGEVDVWTATGSEKILFNEDYTSRYGSKTLSISAFRNEYEAGQIILSADTEARANVGSYDITLNNLTNAEGDVLTADSWTVYNQKYTNVTKVINTETGLRPGWYPDALLPFETAKAHGENSVTFMDGFNFANQGIWLRVKPAKNLKGGVYTGNFVLTIDGKAQNVPVSVKVYDYTLGDYTHTKSSYAIAPESVAYGELDSTQEMLDAYYEFLLDHRVNPQNLTVGGNMQINLNDPAIMEAFLVEATEVSQDPRWTSFNLPFTTTTKRLYTVNDENGKLSKLFTLSDQGKIDFEISKNDEKVTPQEQTATVEQNLFKAMTVVNFDDYAETLRAIAKRSVEESLKNLTKDATEPIDIMKKAATYFIFYDEFDGNGTEATASYCQERAYQTNVAVAAELEALLTCTEEQAAAFQAQYGITFAEYKQTIINECRYLKNKVVGNYSEKLIAKHGQYVPQINYVNDATARENFINYDKNSYGEDNGELWVYTCCFPQAPFSTLHVDDYLISSRLYGWLMYEYNAVGHLYWASVLNNKRYITSAAKDNQLMDYFTDPLRFPSANGDGFLMYAGREYGVYGPIDTVRLQSLQDGVEDYDLLYELEEVYKRRGVSGEQFDNVYEKLHESLHNSMKINYTDDLLSNFQASREALANLLENAYSQNEVIVENYEVKRGNGNVTVSAAKGVNVTCNGQTVVGTDYTDEAGTVFTRYEFEISLDGDVNYVEVVGEKDGVESKLRLNVGGRSLVIGGETLKENLTFLSGATGTLVNDKTVEKEVDGETVQEKVTEITLTKNSDKAKQTLEWKVDGYALTSATKKITMSVYYDGEAPFTVQVFAKTRDTGLIVSVASYTVQKGWNELQISAAVITFGGADDILEKVQLDIDNRDLQFAIGNVTVEG